MKTIKILTIFLGILFLHATLVCAQFQQTSGPEGGVIRAMINHNGTLLAGTLESGIYRSTDGSNSWSQSNTGLQNLLIWTFAEMDSVIFTGTSGGIYKSTDDGVSWSFDGLSAGVISISICGNYKYAGTTFYGIYRSDITMNNWIPKNAGLTNLDVASIAYSDSIIYIGTETGVFKSVNWGNNWTAAGLNYYAPSLAVNQSMIFAGTVGGGIYKSSIGSTNWSYSGNGMYLGEIIQSIKVNGGAMYAGSAERGVYRSNDNGNSWILLGAGLTEKNVLSLECHGTDPVAGTNGGGVFSFDSAGNLWMPHNTGLIGTSVQVLLFQGTALYCGTFYSGLFVSNDNGGKWDHRSSGLPSAPLFSLLQSGQTLFCGIGNGQGIFKSTDQGLTWSFSGLATNTYALAVSAGKLFAGTNFGVYISSDNGNTWGTSNSGLPPSTAVWSFLPKDAMLFAGLNSHGVYLSSDQGNTWVARNNGIANLSVNSLIRNDSILFAGTNDGVYRSSDNGDHWLKVVYGLGSLSVNALANAADGILAGTQNGLFLSRNNGDTWIKVSNGLTDLRVQAVIVSGDSVFVGTTSSGVWANSLSVILGMRKNENPGRFICYPNPGQDDLVIQTDLRNVIFLMTDLLGREVIRIPLISNTNVISTNKLVSGVYLYKMVQSGKVVQTGRWIKR